MLVLIHVQNAQFLILTANFVQLMDCVQNLPKMVNMLMLVQLKLAIICTHNALNVLLMGQNVLYATQVIILLIKHAKIVLISIINAKNAQIRRHVQNVP